MMDAVKYRGADRQQLHERIRVHSMAASKVEAYEALVAKDEDTCALIERANEEEDLSLLEEAESEAEGVKRCV